MLRFLVALLCTEGATLVMLASLATVRSTLPLLDAAQNVCRTRCANDGRCPDDTCPLREWCPLPLMELSSPHPEPRLSLGSQLRLRYLLRAAPRR